jgi:hypothetical protein
MQAGFADESDEASLHLGGGLCVLLFDSFRANAPEIVSEKSCVEIRFTLSVQIRSFYRSSG